MGHACCLLLTLSKLLGLGFPSKYMPHDLKLGEKSENIQERLNTQAENKKI